MLASETGPVTVNPKAPFTVPPSVVPLALPSVIAEPSVTGPPMPSVLPALMLVPERLTPAPVRLIAPLLTMGWNTRKAPALVAATLVGGETPPTAPAKIA